MSELSFVSFGGDGKQEQKAPNSVRVVAWNTLADQYIRYQKEKRPAEDWRIFDQCHRHRRLGKILQKLVDIDVDFICLQEVDFSIARETLVDSNFYTRLLNPTGYGRGNDRIPPTSNGRWNARSDACCIFYKTFQWTLVGQKIVEFDDLAGGNPFSTEFSKSFHRGNFGIIAWFQHQQIPDRR